MPGELGGCLFFNISGIGLDARVASRFNARASHRRGLLPYLTITVHELLTYQPRRYTITVDGAVVQRRSLLIVCANGRQYGSGAVGAPRARIDDRALELVVVEGRSRLANLWEARRLFRGDFMDAPHVMMSPFTSLEVTADEPVLFHVDGEPKTGGPSLIARVRPGALRVRLLAPRRDPDASEMPAPTQSDTPTSGGDALTDLELRPLRGWDGIRDPSLKPWFKRSAGRLARMS